MIKKTLLVAATIGFVILTAGCSNDVSVNPSEPAITTACGSGNKQIINADHWGRVTLQGYDAVAFHTVGAAVRGNPSIVAEYLGYKYLFSSDDNKALFEADPETYLPAYGGFCAFGVSLGVLFPVEIGTWTIVNNRLILQFSNEFRQVFEQNTAVNIAKADSVWQEMIRKKPKKN